MNKTRTLLDLCHKCVAQYIDGQNVGQIHERGNRHIEDGRISSAEGDFRLLNNILHNTKDICERPHMKCIEVPKFCNPHLHN